MHKSVKFLDSQRFAVIPVGKNNSGKGARQFDVTLQLLDYERPVETSAWQKNEK
jgi:hypothetical protein